MGGPGGNRQRTKGTPSSWFPEEIHCFFLEGRSRCTQSKIPLRLYTSPVGQGGSKVSQAFPSISQLREISRTWPCSLMVFLRTWFKTLRRG